MRANHADLPRVLVPLLGSLAAATLASCGGGGTVFLPPPPSAGPPVFIEIEPNDAPWQADFIATLHQGSHLFVEGHVDGPFGFDALDRFEFVAHEPCEIELVLHGLDPFADLDLCIYDPASGQVVACFESPWNPEQATVVVHEPGTVFQVMVYAPFLHSRYELEVLAWPYPLHPLEVERARESNGEAAAITVLSQAP